LTLQIGNIVSSDIVKLARVDSIFFCNDIAEPADVDVIFGKGKGPMKHPGSIKYRQLVQLNTIAYVNSTTNKQMNAVPKSIVSKIRTSGGRFLAKNKNTGKYYEISDMKVIGKVKQAMRGHHAKIRKKPCRLNNKVISEEDMGPEDEALSPTPC